MIYYYITKGLKYMKRLILTVMLLLLPISAFAGTTTIVNAGSNDGAFRTVLTMIGDKINHTFVQANNPVIAEKHFNKKNVLTMWSTEWTDETLPTVEMNENTIVAVTAYETILCSRTYSSVSEMSGQTIKIATWGDSPVVKKFLDNYGTANNITFEINLYFSCFS